MHALLQSAPLLLLAWGGAAVSTALVLGRAVRIADSRTVSPIGSRR